MAGILMKDCSLQILALDRAMRDLCNSNCPMGGCTILFSGDFRQILPVITRGTIADVVNVSFRRSYRWSHITKFELKTNMRILSPGRDNKQCLMDLLQIGNGEFQVVNGFITLNNIFVLVKMWKN